MRCKACGADMQKKECFCGFFIPDMYDDQEAFDEMLEKQGKHLRDRMIGKMSIGIFSYRYTKNAEDKLVLEKVQEIVLVDSAADVIQGIVQTGNTFVAWLPQTFARIESEKPVTLHVFIKKGDKRIDYKLEVEVPKNNDLWKIGVKIEAGYQIRFLLGGEKLYTETKGVSILSVD